MNNFDFIKDLDGLSRAYGSCNNAEELAISKPDLSIISSRKGAECLARLIYRVAYREEAEQLEFASILSDIRVKNYLKNNRGILNAFHYIRRMGNEAVHTSEEESPDDAIEVLKNLHYVYGETAKRLRLIDSYPDFDDEIVCCENAEPDDTDVNVLADTMYDDLFISKYRVKKLTEDFENCCADMRIVCGMTSLNEEIEFRKKPENVRSLVLIQEYFGSWGVNELKKYAWTEREPQICPEGCSFSLDWSENGEQHHTVDDLEAFVRGILYSLPGADSFRITLCRSHIDKDDISDDNERYNLETISEMIGKSEDFTYRYCEHWGFYSCEKFENGEWIEPEFIKDSELLDTDFGADWSAENLDLAVEFDYDKYPDVLNALHDAVRRHLPEEEYLNCVDAWEGEAPDLVVWSSYWGPRTLREVQNFLDEVNAIIEPIKDECECEGYGKWFMTVPPFAVAEWKWTKDGFRVVVAGL